MSFSGTHLSGTVVRIGDDVDTDVMLPGAYLNLSDPHELALHLLETYPDPEIPRRLSKGNILVAGRNCGMGSSREHAQMAILGRGITAVVAESFARIFLRNCINLGLLAIEAGPSTSRIPDGGVLDIDTAAGALSWDGGHLQVPPHPAFITEIVSAGGLVPWTQARLEQRRAAAVIREPPRT